MKKLIIPFILCIIALQFAVPFASAAESVISYSNAYNGTILLTVSGTFNEWGRQFSPVYDCYPTRMEATFFNASGASGYDAWFTAYITNGSTTPFVDEVVIETSDALHVQTTNTNGEEFEFTFSGSVKLNASDTYWVMVNCTNVISGTGGLRSDTVAAAESYEYINARTGGTTGVYTMTHTLYANSDAEGTPGPLPTGGSYDTSDTDRLTTAIAGYLVPLLLWLLPAFIMGYITGWSKWPILIGLAIGGGLCYLFLGANYLWLVVLSAVGLIGMAYGEIRGGGGDVS